jgi:hypothetical protein
VPLDLEGDIGTSYPYLASAIGADLFTDTIIEDGHLVLRLHVLIELRRGIPDENEDELLVLISCNELSLFIFLCVEGHVIAMVD